MEILTPHQRAARRGDYVHNIEIRFKFVDIDEYNVYVEGQLVGAYNTKTNTLLVVPESTVGTLTDAVIGAVKRQFKVSPDVIR